MQYSYPSRSFSIVITLLLLIGTLNTTALEAQVTPAEVVEQMGRGINLGNTLEPPLEGAWNNGPAQESYFDRYVEAGFENVRIPVRWDQHTGRTAPFAIDEDWMNRVEQVVDWALERDLWVTLNGHHEDWLKNGYANPTLRARYDAIWEQIIARFKDKSEKLLFEIINEPIGMTVGQVDDLNARILAMIRGTNPTRIVIYGGNMYSNAEQLYAAAIPDDDYVVGYFHSYDPWPFAGQAQRGWGSPQDYADMENKMATASAWSDVNAIPITISEFGAIHENSYNDRMRYYAAYVDAAQRHGFSWAVWDDGGMFGVLNRSQGTWPEVKDILIHYYPDSPHRIFAEVETAAGSDAQFANVTWENRRTDYDSIFVERQEGAGAFIPVATLAPNAERYVDESVVVGRSYAYRIYTNRPDGTLLHGYPARISVTSNVQLPYYTQAHAVPGTIDAAEYDLGGQGLAYNDQEENNIPNGLRPDEGVDLEPNGKGGFHIAYVNQGEWVEYTVQVAEDGFYNLALSVASEVAGSSLSVEFPGAETASFQNISATGGWTTHQTITADSSVFLREGLQVMRLNIVGSAPVNIDEFTFTLESTSVGSVTMGAPVAIAPNPVSDWLNVDLGDRKLSPTDGYFTITSIAGEIVYKAAVSGRTNRLDIGHLPQGSYILRHQEGGSAQVWKFIKN